MYRVSISLGTDVQLSSGEDQGTKTSFGWGLSLANVGYTFLYLFACARLFVCLMENDWFTPIKHRSLTSMQEIRDCAVSKDFQVK